MTGVEVGAKINRGSGERKAMNDEKYRINIEERWNILICQVTDFVNQNLLSVAREHKIY